MTTKADAPVMAQKRITITTLTAGQPRPYADSTYRYRVEVEFTPPFLGEPKTIRWTGDTLLWHAINLAWGGRGGSRPLRIKKEVLAKHPQLPSDRTIAWHEDYVSEAVELEPGVAEVTITSPYLD